MADNPEKYTLDADVLGMVWSVLYDSGYNELARVVSDTMIAQGCQELKGVSDASLILMFWKDYMEEQNILHVVPTDDKEIN
tara:strand:+ start:384 stop:626 length:243 start_codon:yes stop_codon:yes gene_type:complete